MRGDRLGKQSSRLAQGQGLRCYRALRALAYPASPGEPGTAL